MTWPSRLGKELAAFLLEEHVAADAAKAPAEASTTCCPKCGQPGQAAAQKAGKRGEKLPERTVTTRARNIDIRRERWKCARCRIIFFPLDVRLKLGTEGYSPAVLEKGVRQASKTSSFVEASEDMRELAEIEISPTHLQRLSERIGEE
jgi:transposase